MSILGIPERIVWLLENAEFLCIATLDKRSMPNAANKFLIKCEGCNLYFGDFSKGKTWKNLRRNPKLSIAIMDFENLIDYQINGQGYIVEVGADYKVLLKEYSNRDARFSTKRLIEGLRRRREVVSYQLPLTNKIVIWKVEIEEIIELGPKAELEKMTNRNIPK